MTETNGATVDDTLNGADTRPRKRRATAPKLAAFVCLDATRSASLRLLC